MKKGEDQWVELLEFSTEDERVAIPEMEIDGQKIRPMLQANLRDAQGQPVLMVFSIPMDRTPPKAAAELHRILEAQNLTPTMLVPEQVKCMRLHPVSAAHAKKIRELQRRTPAPEPAPREPPRIIVPGMQLPKQLIVPR